MFEKSIQQDFSFYLKELENCRQKLYLDQITGFYNQLGFIEKFDEAFPSPHSTAVIAVYIENIDEIQRNYSHIVSNYYLKIISNKLKILLRNSIMNAYISTNLILSVTYYNSIEDLKNILRKLKYNLQGPFIFKGAIFPIKIKTCACCLNKENIDKLALLTILRRFFSLKNEEDVCIIYYDQEKENLDRNLPLFLELSKKITMGEIGFSLQPIIDSKTKKVELYEVLARIPKTEEKIFEANEFIKKINDLSLMKELERTILYKTLIYLQEHPEIKRISINISLNYLSHNFENDLNKFLKETQINPERIGIEITERTDISLHKNETLLKKLFSLKRKGFQIILDDFGQENSNVNLLKEFPWDIVKIDGDFILSLLENKFDYELIIFLLKLAKIKGFKIVAEFVENEKLADFLKDLGIHYLQGFYVGKPKFIPESIRVIPPLIYHPI